MGVTPTVSNSAAATKYGVTEPISMNKPAAEDLALTGRLIDYLKDTGFFETEEEGRRREDVLGRLNTVITQFVREVARKKGLPAELVRSTTGKIFTFGSFRLGVHGRGADIDTLCVAPQHVTREDFFSALPELLTRYTPPIFTNITLVPDAYVPVMNLEAEGICIDLVFARVPGETSIGNSFDLLSNRMLGSLDDKCVLSVNGSRTTDEVLRLVPNVETFHTALRAVKLWAKRRALYGNSYGYLNGVACAILTARICQLYPNAAAATILSRFFAIYMAWKWPGPVYLKQIEEPGGLGMKVWNPRVNPADRHHRMPIITPAYPSMCSTHNVSASTMQIMMAELVRGNELCKKMYQNHSSSAAEEETKARGGAWEELFAKSDFFARHRHFFQVIAVAKGEAEHRAWSGYVESKVRHLTLCLERDAAQDIDCAPFYPEAFEQNYDGEDTEGLLLLHFHLQQQHGQSDAPRSALAKPPTDPEADAEGADKQAAERKKLYSTAFYIGLTIKTDPTQPRAPRKLLLDKPVNDFKTYVLGWEKFQPALMSLIVRDVKRDNLPDYVFPPGGPQRPAPALRRAASSGSSTASPGRLALQGGTKKRSSEALEK